MSRKILQVDAPADLVCATCANTGVTITIVFPLDYVIDPDPAGGWQDIRLVAPEVDGVPVTITCAHCGGQVKYGPVGSLSEGSLPLHGEHTQDSNGG